MFVKTNTVKAIVTYYQEMLKEQYSASEIEVLTEIVFEKILGYSKMQLRMNQDSFMSESELLLFHFAVKRLKKGEPIQYVLEEAPFYGSNFYVNSDVLIPRPETEELVDLIVKTVPKDASILEVGAGSGCIPIVLKKQLPKSEVLGIDVSAKAIAVARRNAADLGVDVLFEIADILQVSDLKSLGRDSFNVIISNPPYIGNSEKKQMSDQVLDFEPELALFVADSDPLVFYRKIGELAFAHFNSVGQLFFEINQKYGKEVVELLNNIGFKNVLLIQDINNNDRIIQASI
ncbi:MAG: release factor glutamine methyltransferase [Flavobacteriales bacterium]|jgi:release factor glutamine methyltransferase